MQTLKDSIKDQILLAASKEFKEKGYQLASLRHIAHEANISVGNVYRYFNSKQELYEAVIRTTLNEFEVLLSLDPTQYDQPQLAFKAMVETFSSTLMSLIEQDAQALSIALHDPVSSALIQQQLHVFLTRLASQWDKSIDLNLQQYQLLIQMLSTGIFHGCLQAVQQASRCDTETIQRAISMYFELHSYMTYAIQGDKS